MKNKLNGIITLIITALMFVGGFSVLAEDGPSGIEISLPIQSQDVIREYALSQAVYGNRNVWSKSIDYSYEESFTWTNATGRCAEEILDKLFSHEFVFRMTNPKDMVEGNIYLSDSDGNLLFFGNARTIGEDLAKGIKAKYSIWMQDIPLLRNVESAEMLVLGEDGVTARRFSLSVNWNGQMMLPPWMTGSSNAAPAVKFKDGSLVVYRLSEESGHVVKPEGETAEYKINGHYVYNSQGEDLTVKIIETWERPTVLLNLKQDQNITFDVMGIVQTGSGVKFERPSAVFTTYDDMTPGKTPLSVDGPTTIRIPAGINGVRIRFEWNEFGKPQNIYTGPSDGGGGGGLG